MAVLMQKRLSISKEIILVLVIKIILLFFIWFFCFSHPPDKRAMPAHTALHVFNIVHSEPKL